MGDSQNTQNIQIKQWKSFAPAYYINRFEFGFSLIARKILVDSISTCNSPLKHNKNVLFLKQIVTANEKWILYNNEKWKRSLGKQNEPPSTTPKASLHPKKVKLCMWRNWKGSPLLWAPSRKSNSGSYDSFIFTRHCNFGFPFILVFTKFSLWKIIIISNPGKLEKAPGTALYSKR